MKNTRKLAIEARERFYFTGKPCLNGCLSKRDTIDGSCYECRMSKQRIERKALVKELRS